MLALRADFASDDRRLQRLVRPPREAKPNREGCAAKPGADEAEVPRMTITCTGYIPNETNTEWRRRATRNVVGVTRSEEAHAERKVLGQLNNRAVCLLVQDGFPCAKCHKFFVEQSRSLPGVIIKVTANNGMYSLDHTLPAKATVPQILYYWRGGCTYVSMGSRGDGGPPMGFPPHPEFDDID
jgi:hypothetical protein